MTIIRNFDSERVSSVAERITNWLAGFSGDNPVTMGLVLGSGLNGFPDLFTQKVTISFAEIGLPAPGAEGHQGLLHYMEIGRHGVLVFAGRNHYYEGHDVQDTVLGVRAACKAGAKTFIITCASGAVNPDYKPGDLVLIGDHLNFSGVTPLRGTNDNRIGPRFLDMSEPYNPKLRNLADKVYCELLKTDQGMHIGTYAMMSGPEYETPAQIRMLRGLGADMAGMSTVPEVLALRHMGAEVLGISCITNMGAGLAEKIDHGNVVKVGNSASSRLAPLVVEIIEQTPWATD